MSTENIDILVTEQGTAAVIALLGELGVEGEAATDRLARGWSNVSRAQDVATNSERIANAARQAGLTNLTALRSAMDAMTNSELKAGASAKSLADLQLAIANSFKVTADNAVIAAEAINALAPSFSNAAAASDARTQAAIRGAEADAAAARQALVYGEAVSGTAGASARAAAGNDALAASTLRTAEAGKAGTAAALAYRESVTSTVAATTTATVANRTLSESFGALGLAVGAFISIQALVHASDAYVTIQRQLQAVTKSSADATAAYNQLLSSSDKTGQSVTEAVSLFSRLRAATDEAKFSNNQLAEATAGFQIILARAGGTTLENIRITKDFSEAIANNGFSARILNSILQQNPVAAKIFGDALGVNLEALRHQVDGTDALRDRLAKLKSSLSDSVPSVAQETSAYNTNAAAMTKNVAQRNALYNKIGEGGQATAKEQAALNKNTNASINLSGAQATLSSRLNTARIAQDQKTAATIRTVEAEIAQKEASGQYDAAKIINALISQAGATGFLATQTLTVTQAIQILENRFIDFVGSSASAGIALTVVKDIIVLLAFNLGTVTLAITGFFAAIVISKLISLGTTIVDVTGYMLGLEKGTKAATVASYALNAALALDPVVAVGIAIAAVVAYFADWSTVTAQAGTIVKTTLTTIASLFGPIGGYISAILSGWNGVSGSFSSAATTIVVSTLVGISTTIQAIVETIKLLGNVLASFFVAAYQGWTHILSPVQTLSDLWKDLIGDVNAYTAAVQSDAQKQIAAINGTTAALQKQKDAAAAAGAAGGGGGASAQNAAAQAAYAKAQGQPFPTAYRDGGGFTVPGGGGVDSVPVSMMVSPGEVVTVQTRQQADQGIIPHFRDGGSFAVGQGYGIGLGTNLTSSNDNVPTPTNVSGFANQTVTQVSYSTAVAAPAGSINTTTSPVSTDSGSPVTQGSVALPAGAHSIPLNQFQGQLAGANSNGASSTATSSNAVVSGGYVVVPPDVAPIVNLAGAQVGWEIANPNGSVTRISTGDPWNNDIWRNADGSYDTLAISQYPSLANKKPVVWQPQRIGSGVTGGTPVDASSSSSAGAASSASGSSSSNNTASPSFSTPLNISSIDFSTGAAASEFSTQAPTTVSGSGFGQPSFDASGKTIQYTYPTPGAGSGVPNTANVLNGGSYKDKNGFLTLTTKDGHPIGRNGLDMMVAGGSGVDSKLVNLTVSPGERITVQTPQQQAEAAKGGGGANNFSFPTYITTPNMDSAVKSIPQIQAAHQRTARRVAGRM